MREQKAFNQKTIEALELVGERLNKQDKNMLDILESMQALVGCHKRADGISASLSKLLLELERRVKALEKR